MIIRSDQIRSVTQSCPTLCDSMNRSTPGLPVHHQLRSSLRLTSIESVTPSSHLILCCPLSSCPQSLPASGSFPISQLFTEVFNNQPKYWSFSFRISPSNEHPGLTSFRMDWLDLLADQRDSQESSPTPQFKSILKQSIFIISQLCWVKSRCTKW